MTRQRSVFSFPRLHLRLGCSLGCRADPRRSGNGGRRRRRPAAAVATAPVESRRSTATSASPARCIAEEQAEVSAEIAGRVVATPVERGTRVRAGAAARAHLRRPRPTRRCRRPRPTPRRSRRGSGLDAGPAVRRRTRCPRCRTPRRRSSWRRRVRPHPVAARSEGRVAGGVRPAPDAGRSGATAVRGRAERRRAVVSVAEAARARVDAGAQGPGRHRRCARRSPASSPSALVRSATTSRAGTKVATVVRVDPLRVELTVPEQYVSLVTVGQPVQLRGRRVSGRGVRRPRCASSRRALRADQRALTVEAIVAERRRAAEARVLRDRADSAAADGARRSSCPPRRRDRRRHQPRLRRHGRPRRGAHRHDSARRSATRSRSPAASAKRRTVVAEPQGRISRRHGRAKRQAAQVSRHAVARIASASAVRSSRRCSSCR